MSLGLKDAYLNAVAVAILSLPLRNFIAKNFYLLAWLSHSRRRLVGRMHSPGHPRRVPKTKARGAVCPSCGGR